MAQAKTQASTKRSQGSRKAKPQARARGSSSKSKPTTARRNASSNGKGQVETALHAVEGKAKDAGHAVGSAASKARVPLVATGAALAGAAGGLALGVRQGRRSKGLAGMTRRPLVKVKSRDLAKVAKEVGSFSAQMGQVASELQHARKEGNSHRSPVEVVLEGLTARRSRD